MRATLSEWNKAISWETEVISKACEGYGSLDEEPYVIRCAAIRIARIYMRPTPIKRE